MKVIRIEPGCDPVTVDVTIRQIELDLNNLIYEEVLPVEGTMSLSALRTDGLESNDLMAGLTGDDGYCGTVYICAQWYEELTRDQIYALFDWFEREEITDGYEYCD